MIQTIKVIINKKNGLIEMSNNLIKYVEIYDFELVARKQSKENTSLVLSEIDYYISNVVFTSPGHLKSNDATIDTNCK